MKVTIKGESPLWEKYVGVHTLTESVTIKDFLKSLGLNWDEDVLVIINEKISNGTEMLQDEDKITFLIPLAGG